MVYKFLLFDADDTLFDFQSSAEKCFLETCKEFGFEKEKSDYSVYKVINQRLWDEYSRGERDKASVLVDRYSEYNETMGVYADPTEFQLSYEEKLAHTSIVFPETESCLKRLKADGYKIYLITNGVKYVQNTRLDLSGLRPYFDGIFISDELGVAKPSDEYFNAVASAIPDFDKDAALIIGDSLVSDIPLGKNNGVKTCFMNYFDEPLPENEIYDYKIRRLNELFKILEENNNG